MNTRRFPAAWQRALSLAIALTACSAAACATEGGPAAVSRRGASRAASAGPQPDPRGKPRPGRQVAAARREAEARRIAALTAQDADGAAYNPDADPDALYDDLFPRPPNRVDRPLALYEPAGDRMLHLAGTMLRQDAVLVDYVAALGKDLEPAGLAAWIPLKGTRGWQVDVEHLAKALELARTSGGLLNLALSFSDKVHGSGEASDVAVATTTEWDKRIDEIADLIRVSGVRVLLRIGNEINGWQGHHPFVFPVAYRKIVRRFRERGADKVAFVWCVVPHGDADIFGVNESGEYRWFPGEDFIDWYSVNVFDRLHFSPLAGRGRVGAGRFSSVTEQLLARARRVGKPVLIGETTPQRMNVLSDREDPRGEHGDTVWQEWFLPFLAFLDIHPEIKAVTMLPVDWRKTSAWSDWGDARIHRNPAIIARWRDELSGSRWLHLPDVVGDTAGVLGTGPEDRGSVSHPLPASSGRVHRPKHR